MKRQNGLFLMGVFTFALTLLSIVYFLDVSEVIDIKWKGEVQQSE